MVSRRRLHHLPAIDLDANFPALLFLASGTVNGAHPSGCAREDRGDIAPPRLLIERRRAADIAVHP
jgi:hypothetical protein